VLAKLRASKVGETITRTNDIGGLFMSLSQHQESADAARTARRTATCFGGASRMDEWLIKE